LAGCLVLLAAAFVFRPGPVPRIDRVVLLGFDGASPNLIEPLLAEGRLPAIARLRHMGSHGPLKSFRPTKSGVLWTSVATGKSMLKHGVVDWTYVDQAGLQVPYADSGKRVRSYWEMLSERGISTGTINWWVSYPPTPLPNGFVVSGAFRKRRDPDTVHPPRLFDWLDARRLPRQQVAEEMRRQGFDAFTRARSANPRGGSLSIVDALAAYFARDVTVDRVSDFLWERQPVQVFSTYFRLVDVTSHFAEHFIEREVFDPAEDAQAARRLPAEQLARLDREMARAAAPAYAFMDRTIGKYLGRLDGRTLLIVCSDHGFRFHDGHYYHYHPTLEAPDGVLMLAGPGVRAGQRLEGASLFDIAPTILHAMGQAVAEDMDGAPLLGAFEDRWVRAHPVRRIASYEAQPRLAAPGAGGREEVEEEVLEDLRTLGYIDAGPAKQP
jgi:arylsulfatase A-like enzyme